MRILQMALYGSVRGGTESYIRALCEAQRAAGHEVALAYRYDADPTRPEVRDGFEVRAIASTGSAPSVAERSEVDRVLASFRPDLVHVHNVEASWLPLVATESAPVLLGIHDHRLDCPTGTRYWAAWGKACGIEPGAVCLGYNVVAHCGSLRANATLRPYLRWRRHRDAARRVRHIQVFSDYMAASLASAGVDRKRIGVTPYPLPPMASGSPMATGDERPVVFATGRLVKEKGFATLIEALDHVTTPVLLAIAGEGHHAPALREQAARVPARHRIRFLGWLPSEELAGWYEAAAVVAVPSAWPEPFGIVGLEAMAARKAVVASDVGGIRQWLEDGVTGLAVAARDPVAFARGIERLLDDPALRESMGAAGAARTASEFSMAVHLDRLDRLYASAAASWKAAA